MKHYFFYTWLTLINIKEHKNLDQYMDKDTQRKFTYEENKQMWDKR